MKRLLLLSLLLFWIAALPAQTPSAHKSPALSEATPESAGMSSSRLARIDAMAQSAIADGDIPGMIALVARNGKIVYHKSFGMSDVETGRKFKNDDIFRIASQTKAITATAVMMLWEEGKFRLDDPISKYIPEFKQTGVLKSFRYADTSWTTEPVKKEITIRHLLTHTSGIGYGGIDSDERFRMIFQKAGIIDAFTTQPVTIGENIKKLAALPLHFHPGEQYSYSEGLDVLGYFVEIVSGMPFDQFLKTRLFDPLGMKDTYFYLPDDRAARLIPVQQPNNGKWGKIATNGFFDADYPINGAKTFFAGGAGLSSTARDYATFLMMYLNGGELNGTRFLSRTTIETIMQNQISDYWKGQGKHYGLAFGVVNEKGAAEGGLGSLGTFDWGGYFNTQYFADPKEKIIGILIKQTVGTFSDDTGWQFRQLVFQAVDD
ncbi:MAG: serine hydrolase domain-containing protein [Bacteroidia bacterium]|nr:serine hydrolase domain-containing protein [Bacteroidia bacterium]